MKKYLTYTLLCITISYISHAQENLSAGKDIDKISSPFRYLNEISFRGKNFLFDGNWVKARLLTANNSIVSNDSFLYNVDKIEQRLLFTSDFRSVYEIDRREFKAVLFYFRDSAYVYKHINFINNKDLFEVIVNDNDKYSLYKVMRTKIVKGRFESISFSAPNMRSSDIYQDIAEYYVFFPNKEYRKIHLLKKAAIIRLFKLEPDTDKVGEYLNMVGNKDVYAENDLIQLIHYLNNQML